MIDEGRVRIAHQAWLQQTATAVLVMQAAGVPGNAVRALLVGAVRTVPLAESAEEAEAALQAEVPAAAARQNAFGDAS